MARRVTAKWLRENEACEEELLIFQKEWPHGVYLRRQTIERAVALGINIDWFGQGWLRGHGLRAFRRVADPAWDVYTAEKWTRKAERVFQQTCAEALIAQVEAGRAL